MVWRSQDGWFSNGHGIGVRFGGRYALEYRCGQRIALVSYERGRTEAGPMQYTVFTHDLMRWEPPHQSISITAADLEDLRRNIQAAILAWNASFGSPTPSIEVVSRTYRA